MMSLSMPATVQVRYMGALGNQLFQYVLGRIIAEELGFSLQASAIPGFVSTKGFAVEGADALDPDEVHHGHVIDLDAVRFNRAPRTICLEGYFQRYEYYRPYKQLIRSCWLAFCGKGA